MCSASGSYREGDVRLVGGAYNWEGRVEIFWSGSWGTISDSLILMLMSSVDNYNTLQ